MINVWNRASDSDSTHHNANSIPKDSDSDSTKMNYNRFRFPLWNRSQNHPFNSDTRVGIAPGLHNTVFCVFVKSLAITLKMVTRTVGRAQPRED